MPYIIDGNNLVGSSPDISLDDPEARAKILYIVRQYQNNRKNNVVIVFDGDPGSDEINGVPGDASKFSIVYSRHGNSADNEIKGILDRLNYYKDVTLVTSDKNLKSFAKKKGVKTVNCREDLTALFGQQCFCRSTNCLAIIDYENLEAVQTSRCVI